MSNEDHLIEACIKDIVDSTDKYPRRVLIQAIGCIIHDLGENINEGVPKPYLQVVK